MKKKLIFVNDVPNQFVEQQEYVKKIINNYFCTFDLDCELKIKFIDFACVNEYEYTNYMLKNKSIKKHELFITNLVLKTINNDGGVENVNSNLWREMRRVRLGMGKSMLKTRKVAKTKPQPKIN